MLRGGVIVITALFSVFFLKKKLKRHHYIGCTMAIIGITVVGSVNFIFPKDGNAASVET